MVVGLGVDLVETSRVESILGRWGNTFLDKIMGPAESSRLPPGPDRVRAVALAIAGKEAASKALGTGWSRGVRWRDVVVDLGEPSTVRLEGGAAAFARRLGSSGRTRSALEIRGELAVGEVWLLT
ncbi:MAG TPA: 4'-phosphopantetheinyl transferase superfamily protein [Vicinamibacteria bacterium]